MGPSARRQTATFSSCQTVRVVKYDKERERERRGHLKRERETETYKEFKVSLGKNEEKDAFVSGAKQKQRIWNKIRGRGRREKTDGERGGRGEN